MASNNKYLGFFFILSLMANMFLLGVFASQNGSWERFGPGPVPHDRQGPPSPIMHLQQAAQTLPDGVREQVEVIIEKHNASMQTDMAQMGGLFQKMHTIITAPDYNADEFVRIQQAISSADQALKQNMESMVGDIAAILTHEQRKNFFKVFGPPPFAHPDSKNPEKLAPTATENPPSPVL